MSRLTHTSPLPRLAALGLALTCIAAPRAAEPKDASDPVARLTEQAQAKPTDASAWHRLGLAWRDRGGVEGFEKAAEHLAKAVNLEPNNAEYVGDYGGVLMELADRTRSFSAATKGRDTMERAVALNPDNLDAREGLYQFYLRAPGLVGGSTKKAVAQLEEIRRRDPTRATVLEVIAKTGAKQFTEAFALCEQVLSSDPNHYVALYQFGRTASMSGQNLERGLQCLRKMLTLPPPSSSAPRPTNAWFRIGDIEEKLGHRDAALSAYEEALKLDALNRQATAALSRLKSAP